MECTREASTLALPGEDWISVAETTCEFEPAYYRHVMLNLIRHPEITSTYLYRAELFYDSFHDPDGRRIPHIKAEWQPRPCRAPQYELQQTFVRRLVPRNPQRDAALVQTCHVLQRQDASGRTSSLVLYVPHIASADDLPFYHPAVASLAFLHTWTAAAATPPRGTLSIHSRLFASRPLDTRLARTALRLLAVVHKHALAQRAGYTKRVLHDQVVAQARFQDTYTRLKSVYARALIHGWVEQTPASKHVFEDLGIAAFLLELWADMYNGGGAGGGKKPAFPGFVDVGCGNGLLVHLLRSEGYAGWGFDARRRRTWATLPEAVQRCLKQLVLVPEPFARAAAAADDDATGTIHTGIFPPRTFIISNHADQLTPWTPLLAHLSYSPFLAIPCCSHNLAGARFRAPAQQHKGKRGGDTRKTASSRRQPSAYATLCDWVMRLAVDMEYAPEKEMLRIPSTRNVAIIGRRRSDAAANGDRAEHDEQAALEKRLETVRRVLDREIIGSGNAARGLDIVAREWIERTEKLAKGQGRGH